MKSLTFNGQRKTWLYLLQGRYKPPFAPIQRDLIYVPGMDGAYLGNTNLRPLYINQPVGFVVKNDEHALQLKDELADWLMANEPVPLQFDDEPDRTYYAVVQNTIEDFERFVNLRQGTIQFLCLDPYSYGEEQTIEFQSDSVMVENKGTAETEPIFELTAKEPTTFAMVSNGDEYMMVGRPLSDEEEAYEPITSILNDQMNSLVGWTDATYIENGVISGIMATDSDGFYASDFGSGTGWYGPAKKRALSDLLQDFQAQIHIENLNLNGQMGMIEVYFLDVNDNVVAKLGIEDAWKDVARMQAKFQLGTPSNRHSIYGHPERHSHWYNYRGIMRIERIGQEFKAKFAIIESGMHKHEVELTYLDYANEYQTPIAQIQVAIRRRTANPTQMRINHIYVNKLNHEPNGVPYIANPGDKIIFNHQTRDVYLNGESVPFDFGADFFTLKKGENSLVVLPEGVFDTKVRFREKFK